MNTEELLADLENKYDALLIQLEIAEEALCFYAGTQERCVYPIGYDVDEHGEVARRYFENKTLPTEDKPGMVWTQSEKICDGQEGVGSL